MRTRTVGGMACSFLAIGLTACPNDVRIVEDGDAGSTTNGSTSASTGSGSTPHPVGIAVDLGGPIPGDQLLVLHNRADGSLVQSWLATELPVTVSATDGDLVTYAYSAGYPVGSEQDVVSFRVSPQVNEVRHRVESFYSGPTPACPDLKKMTAHVHVPEVAGAAVVEIHAWPGSGNGSEYFAPADVDVPVSGCGEVFSLFTAIRYDSQTILAFELVEDIALVDGADIDLFLEPKNEPRNPITVDVDDLDGATKATAFARWDGMFHENPVFFSAELADDLFVDNPAPFVFSTNQLDLPGGEQLASVQISDPPTAEACGRGASFHRVGRSDVPFSFHAHGLAEPIPDGVSWTLGPGTVGDAIARVFAIGATCEWRLHEDPAAPGFSPVYPEFPTEVPTSLANLPTDAPVLTSTTHVDFDDAAGFAGFADVSNIGFFAFPRTIRARYATPCP